MAVQGYYDFINHAFNEGENSAFVQGLAEQKTPGKRRKYLKEAGFEFTREDLMDIDDKDVMNKSGPVLRWLDWWRPLRTEIFGK